jgi:hypothetical protein
VLAGLAPYSQTVESPHSEPSGCKAGWKNVLIKYFN